MEREEIQKKIQLTKDNCIFCKIVKKELKSHTIFEDEKCLSVLDISPASKGHLLLIPKDHYQILQSVPDNLLGHMSSISSMLSELLKETFKAENIKLLIANGLAAGQQLQHFVIHIIPEYQDQEITLNFKEGSFSTKKEIKTIQKNLKEKLEKLNESLT